MDTVNNFKKPEVDEFYKANNLVIFFTKGLETIWAFRLSDRLLLADFVESRWLLPDLFRISLPVPVMCTLFATDLQVFILGIVFSFHNYSPEAEDYMFSLFLSNKLI
jgi:hypothetical protein